MKCHYEVLGVPRDADDSEIKTAYRKLALRWHPDKNLNDAEEAKEQFQLVQQAYEVLSDLHERAWYDNHRDQILRGKNSDYQENCLDLFQYFTASCFKGYSDDPGGFYHTYADVFEKIAAEDAEFMDDEEEIARIPKFGNSRSNYEEEVGPFYAYWQSYCTKKSYSWLCPYNINEIKDRRILREIEKDMKKIVQKARRERNEEVRNLISFVRKRDKRVQSYKKLLEEKAALNRQKQEQNRLEQLRKRKKELEEIQKNVNTSLNDSYEEQLRQLEQEYDDSEDETDSGDEDVDDDVVLDGEEIEASDLDSSYCAACNKLFTTNTAFLNHQSSKKHKINVEILKESFREEIEAQKKQTTLDAEESEPDEAKVVKSKNKKNKKSKKSQVEVDEEDTTELPDLLGQISTEENEWDDGSKSKKKQKSKKKPSATQPLQPKENNSNDPKSIKAENNETPPSQIDVQQHTCVTCKATFESKNKLFAHLKKTDHGVYISKNRPAPVPGSTEKTKKGKRNK